MWGGSIDCVELLFTMAALLLHSCNYSRLVRASCQLLSYSYTRYVYRRSVNHRELQAVGLIRNSIPLFVLIQILIWFTAVVSKVHFLWEIYFTIFPPKKSVLSSHLFFGWLRLRSPRSRSRLSAPAPTKLGRLRLQATKAVPAPYT